jgi:hypothetical protein
LNVERRRFIETAHRMIKQNVGVLEIPGDHDQRQRDSGETDFARYEKQECEDDDNTRRSTARGTDEMMNQIQVMIVDSISSFEMLFVEETQL